MVRADFFCSRCNYHALVYQFFIPAYVKVFVNLLVIDETQITMISYVTRPYAIDGIDGTSLELVKVASDNFSSSLDIWD